MWIRAAKLSWERSMLFQSACEAENWVSCFQMSRNPKKNCFQSKVNHIWENFPMLCTAQARLCLWWWNDNASFLCSYWKQKAPSWLSSCMGTPGEQPDQALTACLEPCSCKIQTRGTWRRCRASSGERCHRYSDTHMKKKWDTQRPSRFPFLILKLHLSATEQRFFHLWPLLWQARRTRWDRPASTVFSVPEQQKQWSDQNTCRLKVMRPPVLPALINSARH